MVPPQVKSREWQRQRVCTGKQQFKPEGSDESAAADEDVEFDGAGESDFSSWSSWSAEAEWGELMLVA
jgi:hypothetical protein